ncbi:MAG: TIGR01244 family sulfur transferase [Rhodospirillaceae bacterium]
MLVNRLHPGFAVSGQIGVRDVAEIAAAGFAMLVNNRPDGESADQPRSAEIEAEAVRLGLLYLHIPIEPGQLLAPAAMRLAAVMRNSPGPILAFCRTGARSTNLWKAAQQIGTANPSKV